MLPYFPSRLRELSFRPTSLSKSHKILLDFIHLLGRRTWSEERRVGGTAGQVFTQQFVWNGFTATALGPGINGNSGSGPDATIGTLRTTFGIIDSGTLSVTGSASIGGSLTVGGGSIPVVVGNVNTEVTQTGDTSLHTIYTVPVPALGPNDQLRILLLVGTNVTAGSPTILINYGSSRISPGSTISAGIGNANGQWLEIVGGNLGATNSQSWDTLQHYLLDTASTGNGFHNTTAVDSTTGPSLTVTYQGGANTDSVTFYRMIVEKF